MHHLVVRRFNGYLNDAWPAWVMAYGDHVKRCYLDDMAVERRRRERISMTIYAEHGKY